MAPRKQGNANGAPAGSTGGSGAYGSAAAMQATSVRREATTIMRDVLKRRAAHPAPRAVRAAGGGYLRQSSFRQKQLLAQFGKATQAQLDTPCTNAEFNQLLSDHRDYSNKFTEQYGSRPASVWLYDLTAAVHEGTMPNRASATHKEVMALWIPASGGLHADVAIQLIHDFGLPLEEVVALDQDSATEVLATLTTERNSGTLLPQKRTAAQAGLDADLAVTATDEGTEGQAQ